MMLLATMEGCPSPEATSHSSFWGLPGHRCFSMMVMTRTADVSKGQMKHPLNGPKYVRSNRLLNHGFCGVLHLGEK